MQYTATLHRYILPCFLLLALLFADPAQAQNWRASQTYYVQPSVGLSNYIGDQDITPVNFDDWRVEDKIPFNVGLEAGYQVTRRFSIGGGYYVGDYPTIAAADGYSRRHTAELALRYTIMSEHRFVPYLETGFHGTVGETIIEAGGEEQSLLAVGPMLGAGIDYAVSPAASVFFGTRVRIATPDRAVDGLGYDEDAFSRFDVLSDLSLGVRYRFSRAF